MCYFPNEDSFLYFVIYHKARRARKYAKNYVDPIGLTELQLLLEAKPPCQSTPAYSPLAAEEQR